MRKIQLLKAGVSMTVQEHQASGNRKVSNELWEWVKALFIAAAIVIVIRWLLFTPTVVSGPSMEPNFQNGQRIIVNKIIYAMKKPERGDVIVFHAPEEKDFIKRVIALPGEEVMVKGDDVYINGKKLAEPYIQEQVEEAKRRGTSYNQMRNFKVTENGIQPMTVPEGTVFVMGDNRPLSKDSRDPDVGFIPIEQIVGRADFIFWPLGDMRLIRHPNNEVIQ